jgi:TonB family protein
MSAVDQSAPASLAPRRTPSIVRLTPHFVNEVCTQQQRILQLRANTEFPNMGLLFGTVAEHLVSVQAFKLLNNDECNSIYASKYKRRGDIFESLIAASKTEPELLSLNLVGWFSTRPLTGLLSSDIEFHNRYFRRASDVALVFKPEQSSEFLAELYARSSTARLSTENYRWASLHLSSEAPATEPVEVTIQAPISDDLLKTYQPPRSASLERSAPPAPEPEARPLSAGEAPGVETEAAKSKRRLLSLSLRAVSALVILVVFALWGMKMGRGIAALSIFRTVRDTDFQLRAKAQGDALLVSWNRQSPFVQSAVGGVLRINDGSEERDIPLNHSQIVGGAVMYTPRSGDVLFRLELKGKDGTTFESTRVLDGRKLQLASSSTPEPETAPPQPPPKSQVRVAEPAGTPGMRLANDRNTKSVPVSPVIASAPEPLSMTPVKPPFTALLSSTSQIARVQNVSTDGRSPVTGPKQSAPPAEGKPTQTTQRETISTSAPPQTGATPTRPVSEIATSKPNQTAQSTAIPEPTPSSSRIPSGTRMPDTNVSAAYVPARPLRQVMPETHSLRALVYKAVEVAVEVTIDKNGRVTAARAVKSEPNVNLAVVGAAINAAKQWAFTPASMRGQDIPSRQTIVFQFQPRQ